MPEHDCGTCSVPGEWQCIRCPRRQPAITAASPSEIWMTPHPRCPTHGTMRYVHDDDRWVCHGWDGEGCPHEPTAEDLRAQYLGHGHIRWETPASPDDDAPLGLRTGPATARVHVDGAALQRLQDMLNGHAG